MITHEALNTEAPVLLMLTHGETLDSKITKALEVADRDGIKVVKINVDDNPEFAQEFNVGKHPVLLTFHCGEVVSRRPRPWASDVEELAKKAKELLVSDAAAPMATDTAEEAAEDSIPNDAPVHVTDATFEELIINSKLPVLIDFWAEWCGPCRMVAPILDKLAKEFAGQVRIAKVDVDANPMLSQQFQIQSIPTLMFVKEGKIVGRSAGAAPEPALRDVIQQLIDLEIPAE